MIYEGCNDNFHVPGDWEAFGLAASMAGAAGLAYANTRGLRELACIVTKTVNTAAALANIAEELDQVRTGVLLNRAAIDYLLLKDHISCDLIPGGCCFNISNNVPYVKYLVQQLKGELQHMFLTNPFSFGGFQWTHWLLMLLGPLVLLLLFLLCLPCIFQGLSVSFGAVWSEILKLRSQLHPRAKKDGIEFQ